MKVRPAWALLVAVVAVVLLPRVPFVNFLLLPLAWLGTLVHESGHALGCFAVGGEPQSVQVFVNGSGLAPSQLANPEPWEVAVVGISGLVGPAVASAGLLWLGLGPRLARVGLGLLGVALLAEAALLTQGFATAVAVGWGLVALLGAWRLHGEVVRLGVLVVAVQLALHVYRGSGYLFAGEAHTGAGVFPSDVSNVATALGGHHLMWGVAIGLLDVVLLGVGLLGFFFGDRLLSTRSAD